MAPPTRHKTYDLSRPEVRQTTGRFSKGDIASVIAHMEGMSLAQANRCVSHVVEAIVFALLQGCEVYLPKLGKFTTRTVPGRIGHHPVTREPVEIAPSVRVQFQLAAPTKDLLEKYLVTTDEAEDV